MTCEMNHNVTVGQVPAATVGPDLLKCRLFYCSANHSAILLATQPNAEKCAEIGRVHFNMACSCLTSCDVAFSMPKRSSHQPHAGTATTPGATSLRVHYMGSLLRGPRITKR